MRRIFTAIEGLSNAKMLSHCLFFSIFRLFYADIICITCAHFCFGVFFYDALLS